MNYDLGQRIYAVSREGYIDEGILSSIRKTEYTQYSDKGIKKYSQFKEYYIGDWYPEDMLFTSIESAKEKALRILQSNLSDIQDCIQRVEEKTS